MSTDGTQTIELTGKGEKSLATHYYRAILRRAADTAGKDYWESEAARLVPLGVDVNETWFAMAMQFFASDEYAAFNRDDTGFATDLYATFFNRAPDAEGLGYWTGQMTSGMPREVVLASFMFSTEFGAFTEGIFGKAAARAETNVVMDFYHGHYNSLTYLVKATSFINAGNAALYGYCWAGEAGQHYLNARWTYTSCAFGASVCGFSIQHNEGPY